MHSQFYWIAVWAGLLFVVNTVPALADEPQHRCKFYYANDLASVPQDIAPLLKAVAPWAARVTAASPELATMSVRVCLNNFRAPGTSYSYRMQMPVQKTGGVCHFASVGIGRPYDHAEYAGPTQFSYDELWKYSIESMLISENDCPRPVDKAGFVDTRGISVEEFRGLLGVWKTFMSGADISALVQIRPKNSGTINSYDPVKAYEGFRKSALPRYLAHPPLPDFIGVKEDGVHQQGDYVINTTYPDLSFAGWNFTVTHKDNDWKIVELSYWIS